jgi:protein SYS1
VLYLVLIVRRSQLIIDFVLTLQFFNLLFTIWDNWHFPVSLLWWLTRFVETGIMIFGGRHFCRVRELRPIEFGMYEMVPTTTQQQKDIEGQQTQNGMESS